MKYDPIKHSITSVVRANVFLRKALYKVLGVLFLREWYVRRELRSIMRQYDIRTMLDAGSGLGQYSYYCARRFPRLSILAVDVKKDQISDCAEFFPKAGVSNVRFAVEDLVKPHHKNEFDLILSVDVMEHIENDVKVFQNFGRALKAHGLLVVNTPSNLGGSDAHSPDDKSFIEEHARIGYGTEEIRSKLESAGLRVERVRFTYGPWGSRAWRAGIKVPLLIVNTSPFFFLILPFYYLLVLPITLLFMYLDYSGTNKAGTGLLVVARKADQSTKSDYRISKQARKKK